MLRSVLHESDHRLHWVTPTLPSLSCPVTPQPPTPLIFSRGLVLLVLSLPTGPVILRLGGAVCVLLVPSLCVLRGLLFHMEFIRLSPLTTQWSPGHCYWQVFVDPLGISLSPCRRPRKRQEGCACILCVCLLNGPAVPPSSLRVHSVPAPCPP